MPRRSAAASLRLAAQLQHGPKRLLGRLPYVLLLAVLVVCLGKILIVSPNPKVLIVGLTDTSYIQPTDVYQRAAAKIQKTSPANRLKLSFNTAALVAGLKKQFPELQSVSVTLPLVGNRPIVYIAPQQPGVVLQVGAENFAISQSGIVLSRRCCLSKISRA